jgi:hypothetical protein
MFSLKDWIKRKFPPLPPHELTLWMVRTAEYDVWGNLTKEGRAMAPVTAATIREKVGDDPIVVIMPDSYSHHMRPCYAEYAGLLAQHLQAATNADDDVTDTDRQVSYLRQVASLNPVETFTFNSTIYRLQQLAGAGPNDHLHVVTVVNGSWIVDQLRRFPGPKVELGFYGPPLGSAHGLHATVDRKTGNVTGLMFV